MSTILKKSVVESLFNTINKQFKFPCTTNKCILYPTCKLKTKLSYCKILTEHLTNISEFTYQELTDVALNDLYHISTINMSMINTAKQKVQSIQRNILWHYMHQFYPSIKSIVYNDSNHTFYYTKSKTEYNHI